ncbi:MAG: hypothetical protein R6U46_05175 [Marinilabilia sp.]
MKKGLWTVLAGFFLLAAMPMTFASTHTMIEDEIFNQDEDITFFEVEVEEVPEAVSEAAAEDNDGADIVKAELAYIGGEQIYKLTMNKDDEELKGLYKSDGTKYNPEE